MAKLSDVIEYLKRNNAPYEVIDHAPAYSAHEVALASHVLEKDLAKTLIVYADGKYFMFIMPADHRIVDHQLHEIVGGKHIHLATEEDLQQLFPDCEIGAMPPFGNLYALPVFVDNSLTGDEMITFNACSHTRSIRMKMADFQRLVKPTVAEFSQSRFEIKEP